VRPATASIHSLFLHDVLLWISASASERDRAPAPAFPTAAIDRLEQAGALAWNAQPGVERPPASDELALVRGVARADGSVGRILDGHLNAVERLAVQAPDELRDRELAAVRARRLRAGVWGGDPRPGEGPPATVLVKRGADVLRGIKTFCSGAGGLDRALVLARNPEQGPPLAVWVDLGEATVEVDESWYRGSGLRASVSHRVVFHDTPVIARLGLPGSLAAQPWFARDALRTAASWAGMADTALDAALEELGARPDPGPLEQLAAGRMLSERGTIDALLSQAGRAMDSGSDELPAVSLHARVGIAAASRRLLDEAARVCGSHPFAVGAGLDRASRDLQLFLLQHRLDPMLAATGASELAGRSG
jgi:alkylation response protein AidB-like acyl-CoA dehydrogenase